MRYMFFGLTINTPWSTYTPEYEYLFRISCPHFSEEIINIYSPHQQFSSSIHSHPVVDGGHWSSSFLLKLLWGQVAHATNKGDEYQKRGELCR